MSQGTNVDPAVLTEALRESCAGLVLSPGSDGYDAAVRGHVLSVSRRPAVVLLAENPGDIAAAVGVASRVSATVGVMATGHASRRGVDPDLLIITSALRGVSVDADRRVASVGAGATWGDVVAAAEPLGLAPLCGSHSSVGAVGYTLGGGLGPLGRRYGFAADRVRSFDVVTAEGVETTADARHHPELFRALRGAGREGLCIVTAMTVGLVPAAEVLGGSLVFDAAEAPRLFAAYAEWVGGVGDGLDASIAIVRYPELPAFPDALRGRTVVQVELCHSGPEEEAAEECAAVEGWGTPIHADLRRRPLSELLIDTPPDHGWGGAIALRELAPEGIDAILDAVGPERDAPFFLAQLRRLGGALDRRRAAAPAVSGRDADQVLFLAGLPVPELIGGPIPRAADALFARLEPWASPSLPINFADHLDRAGRAPAWPSEVRAEIESVRADWDPAGMFRHWAGQE